MSQEKLNRLSTLCIEKEMIEHIDVDKIIDKFVPTNLSRNYFV